MLSVVAPNPVGIRGVDADERSFSNSAKKSAVGLWGRSPKKPMT